MSHLSQLERDELANKLERSNRVVIAGLIIWMAIVVVDVFTGWMFDNRRVDLALLAACVAVVATLMLLRRVGKKLRLDAAPRRPDTRTSVATIATLGLSVATTVLIGYLFGGWTLAIVLTTLEIVLMGVSWAHAVRQKRHQKLQH